MTVTYLGPRADEIEPTVDEIEPRVDDLKYFKDPLGVTEEGGVVPFGQVLDNGLDPAVLALEESRSRRYRADHPKGPDLDDQLNPRKARELFWKASIIGKLIPGFVSVTVGDERMILEVQTDTGGVSVRLLLPSVNFFESVPETVMEITHDLGDTGSTQISLNEKLYDPESVKPIPVENFYTENDYERIPRIEQVEQALDSALENIKEYTDLTKRLHENIDTLRARLSGPIKILLDDGTVMEINIKDHKGTHREERIAVTELTTSGKTLARYDLVSYNPNPAAPAANICRWPVNEQGEVSDDYGWEGSLESDFLLTNRTDGVSKTLSQKINDAIEKWLNENPPQE